MKKLIVTLNQKEMKLIFGGEDIGRNNNDQPKDTDWTNSLILHTITKIDLS